MLDGREREYVLDCLDTNWVSSLGEYIARFERQFATICDAAYGVACCNGTAAIHLALEALDIGPGDEVIVPAFTLIVSANMVCLTGATPVLVDVRPDTWCIDPDLIEQKITPRTKAIMAVHMYGQPCEMDATREVARRHGLKVIEDGAQAHGARYRGKPIGGIGDIGCFSFYGNKILTTGEGGMLVTSDKALAERAALLRNQAFEQERFLHHHVGFNYRMTNVQAAIGLAQCERLTEKLRRKAQIARTYDELLADEPDVRRPAVLPDAIRFVGCTAWSLRTALVAARGKSALDWRVKESRRVRSSFRSTDSRSTRADIAAGLICAGFIRSATNLDRRVSICLRV